MHGDKNRSSFHAPSISLHMFATGMLLCDGCERRMEELLRVAAVESLSKRIPLESVGILGNDCTPEDLKNG